VASARTTLATPVSPSFAGSGALGLSAALAGARHATVLDKDAAAIKLIGENLRKLGETGVAKVVRADATGRRRRARAATSSSSIRPTARPGRTGAGGRSTRPAGWRRAPSSRSSWRTTRTSSRRWALRPIDERRYGAAKIAILRKAP